MSSPQNVLFEEDGAFKVGTIMSDAGASLQVEHTTGRRVKIKGAQVMLRFDRPSASELMPAAQKAAAEIDLDFLWECAPQDEFSFTDLASEYFGAAPSADQSAALLFRLHSAPVYFHRKGRGRYRPAPPEILRAALAAVERKRLQELQIEQDAKALVAGQLPPAVGRLAAQLLVRPDKQGLEFRALDRASIETQRSPERLLLAAGAFASARELHRARFIYEYFPAGEGFAAAALSGDALADLPLADVQPFSIDDSTTTEIDDCLSVSRLPNGHLRVGVHIAAPGLSIVHGDHNDLMARERMSTVYMPGEKITMLPDEIVGVFSLDAGREVAALSLYADLDERGQKVIAIDSRVERIRVAANLRHDQLDGLVTEAMLEADDAVADPRLAEFVPALRHLWKFTLARTAERERVRGKPEPKFRSDFSFYIDGETVRIVQRRRDAPLDRIVAEMMILVNSEWGQLLAAHKVPGIYRSQQAGRVRTTSYPLPHQGLGVAQYMWASSPLRRYVDLVNQRQVIALLQREKAPFDGKDAELFALMSAFDARYSAYADFQTKMERYWCLRWLEQNGVSRIDAVVIREDLVRLAEAPFYFRLAQLPELAPGRRIQVEVLESDTLTLDLRARYLGLVSDAAVEVLDDESEELTDAVDAAVDTGEAAGDSVEAAGDSVEAAGATDPDTVTGLALAADGDQPVEASLQSLEPGQPEPSEGPKLS